MWLRVFRSHFFNQNGLSQAQSPGARTVRQFLSTADSRPAAGLAYELLRRELQTADWDL